LKLLLTKKEHLNEEEENPKWEEHTLLLSLAAMVLTQNQRPAPSTQQAERSWLKTRA
jgi:hypothetical protein